MKALWIPHRLRPVAFGAFLGAMVGAIWAPIARGPLFNSEFGWHLVIVYGAGLALCGLVVGAVGRRPILVASGVGSLIFTLYAAATAHAITHGYAALWVMGWSASGFGSGLLVGTLFSLTAGRVGRHKGDIL